MYKKDLALNDLQWLMCHRTKPNPISLERAASLQLKLSLITPLLLVVI